MRFFFVYCLTRSSLKRGWIVNFFSLIRDIHVLLTIGTHGKKNVYDRFLIILYAFRQSVCKYMLILYRNPENRKIYAYKKNCRISQCTLYDSIFIFRSLYLSIYSDLFIAKTESIRWSQEQSWSTKTIRELLNHTNIIRNENYKCIIIIIFHKSNTPWYT